LGYLTLAQKDPKDPKEEFQHASLLFYLLHSSGIQREKIKFVRTMGVHPFIFVILLVCSVATFATTNRSTGGIAIIDSDPLPPMVNEEADSFLPTNEAPMLATLEKHAMLAILTPIGAQPVSFANAVPFGPQCLVALDRSKDRCHDHQGKNALDVHTLHRPPTGTSPAPNHAATRTSSDLSSELGSTIVVVSGGETTSLFARHRQQRRNKHQQRQQGRPLEQQQSPQQIRNSATNKVNHRMFILLVFVLVVWMFVICVPGNKKKKMKQKIWSSETRSTLNFISLVAMLCLCVSSIHSIIEASKALATAAAVAPSPPSSDTFGIEDVEQRACTYVEKKG